MTETTICNLALGKIGDKRIMSLTDASPEARACKLIYEATRDEVLRGSRWNFATRRTTLSRLAAAPAFGWAAQYQLPVDCLRVLQLNGFEDNEQPSRWEVEGGRLLTDQDSARIRYIGRVVEANLFDPLFVKALALKVAAEIAPALTGSKSLSGDFLAEYERVIGPKARRANACESRPKRKLLWVESDLVRTRQSGPIG